MAELAARSGLAVRKLRYVFDHRLLPGLRGTSLGPGIPRTFTDFEGFGIALTARLLDAGLSRKLVASVLDVICRPIASGRIPSDVPLYRVFQALTGRLEIGKGRFVRVRTPGRPSVARSLDTGWLSLTSSKRMVSDDTPEVCVIVELGRLAVAIRR